MQPGTLPLQLQAMLGVAAQAAAAQEQQVEQAAPVQQQQQPAALENAGSQQQQHQAAEPSTVAAGAQPGRAVSPHPRTGHKPPAPANPSVEQLNAGDAG